MNKRQGAFACYDNIYSGKIHSFDGIGGIRQADKARFGFSLKDPVSAITHMIGAGAAAAASVPLIERAVRSGSGTAAAAMCIFMVSMILLYSASATYHSLDISEGTNFLLRRIDHSMIFILIAGSYTPVCLLVLPPSRGIPLLITVWGFAVSGIILKIWLIRCPKWVSSVIYIVMGWLCIPVFGPLMTLLSPEGFHWLLAGGIIYTAGGVIYGLKPRMFRHLPAGFGNHEIFHLFVMAGSLCHYLFMYRCILS